MGGRLFYSIPFLRGKRQIGRNGYLPQEPEKGASHLRDVYAGAGGQDIPSRRDRREQGARAASQARRRGDGHGRRRGQGDQEPLRVGVHL